MNTPILIRSYTGAVDLLAGDTGKHDFPGQRHAQRLARTVFPNARCIRDWVHREGWMVRIRVGRGRAHHPRTLIFSKPSEAGRIVGWQRRSVITPPALNFTRPHGAGNRIAARFEPTKQPRSCFANAFHLLRVRVLDHVEKPSQGVDRGRGKISQGRGFPSQGGQANV